MINFLHLIGLVPSGGWIEYLILISILLVIIIAASFWIGGRQIIKFDRMYDPDEKLLVDRLLKYIRWGTVQQVIVMVVFLLLTEVAHMRTLWAIPICAILFGFSHFPNMFLFFATSSLGFFFLNMFVEYRNFYMQGIAHGILATFLMYYMPRVLLTEFSTWKVFADRNKEANKEL
jgi:hypothetical protein